MTDTPNTYFEPIRARRQEFAQDMGAVLGVLQEGNRHARTFAAQTLQEVRDAMDMNYDIDPT